ncbi:uncharacterized protein LOC120350302 [Nilaparvata lugens]|uniref:uncharacterized protein LOC120350302 n=1 Tax=Nilaparvata lugens TaxID=108931 RepID=UPI00193D5DBE|nr:uncharacterized protein LOC120350302 [Nilaparvata lugens]
MEAFKDIVALAIVFICSIEQSLNPQRTLNLVQLIDDEFLVNKNDLVENKHKFTRIAKLHAAKRHRMDKIYHYLNVLFLLHLCGFVARHFLNDLMGIVETPAGSQRWLTPLLVYRTPQPSESTTTAFFVYTFCVHSFVLFTICSEGYAIFTTVCLSTEKLLGDFETLYVLLECLTNDFADSSIHHSNHHRYKSNLRKDMALVVRCHQNINRKFRICAANSAFVIPATIAFVGNDSFANAFFMLKSKSVKRALSFAFMFILENITLFFIYNNGQRIFNQNDKLRKYLAGLPWTDKPRWFRQTVHIMMTRANVDTEMRPYGIFVLNYMSFKDLMKLTFSVGNVLYTKKLARQSQQ